MWSLDKKILHLVSRYKILHVFCGDTLRAETEIMATRVSKSRPTQGIVQLAHRMFNQRGQLVCKCTRQALMTKSRSATPLRASCHI